MANSHSDVNPWDTGDTFYPFVSSQLRYLSVAFAGLLVFNLILSIASKSVVLIVIQVLLCLVFIPYAIWIIVFQKYRVSDVGLHIPDVWNPLRPLFVPWSDIQRVSQDHRIYKVYQSDGTCKISFQNTITRFDQFLDEFRRRSISIESREQKLPTITEFPDSNSSSSLLSSPRKLRMEADVIWIIVVVFGILLGVFGFVFVIVSAAEVIPGSVPVGLYMLDVSLAVMLAGVWTLYVGLNLHIVIKSDGVDFPNRNFGRRFVLWQDFQYGRNVLVSSKPAKPVLRVYTRGTDDYIAAIPSEAEAFGALLKEFNSKQIPLLKETEAFNQSNL